MKKYRSLFLLLFFLSPQWLWGNELYSLALVSTRADNAFLGEMILGGRYEDNLALIQGLGEREDPYISDLLILLATPHKRQWQHEHFLRLLLAARFSGEISAWKQGLMLNREGVLFLLHQLPGLQNPLLKREIFRLCTGLPAKLYVSPVMEEMQRIIASAYEIRAPLHPEIETELSGLLVLIDTSREREFLDPLGRLLPFLTEESIVQQLKTTMAGLLTSQPKE